MAHFITIRRCTVYVIFLYNVYVISPLHDRHGCRWKLWIQRSQVSLSELHEGCNTDAKSHHPA